MIRIGIESSNKYDVLIEDGLINSSGIFIKDAIPDVNVLVVVSDSNVYPIYGERLESKLTECGFKVYSFVIEAGEASKNFANYEALQNFLAEKNLGRKDAIIALGGGVVGDLTGFVAATYKRGIRYIQIPTTLLAMVDSSVGGKTAINTDSGKNLVGAFHQPSLVLCDIDTLDTVSFDDFRSGCAEIIKYALLCDEEMFADLLEVMAEEHIEEVIARCIEIKSEFVSADEFDYGKRMHLNLGHTFGHAIENLSEYTISHGAAVAIGMNMIARAAYKKDYCNEEVPYLVETISRRYSLPVESSFSAKEITDAASSDKKAGSGYITLVVPECIGRCKLVKINVEELIDWCV